MSAISQVLSRVPSLPVLHWLSPAAAPALNEEQLAGFAACQKLAFEAAHEVASLIREGWTEAQAADLLNTYLQDCGVNAFFHKAFAWFGERTRFEGVGSYAQFAPTSRVIGPGEVFILDVAPILKGYICDIGYTSCLGENAAHTRAQDFLKQLRAEIPPLFTHGTNGGEICSAVDRRIKAAGFAPIHHLYPFSVLGHRVHRGVIESGKLGLLNFGWQSYWELLSRGLYGQLLNKDYRGKLDGLWAIEPHIGDASGFGAKFEEILVVENGVARWLEPERNA
jgi:Xaa-Pro aminopeptidase